MAEITIRNEAEGSPVLVRVKQSNGTPDYLLVGGEYAIFFVHSGNVITLSEEYAQTEGGTGASTMGGGGPDPTSPK